MFSLSIGLGALVGGVILDSFGLPGVLWIGGAATLVAVAVWTARGNAGLR
ncbi:hypothetical protein AB0C84_46025 [Actinomadura sp. NPDC048955]